MNVVDAKEKRPLQVEIFAAFSDPDCWVSLESGTRTKHQDYRCERDVG